MKRDLFRKFADIDEILRRLDSLGGPNAAGFFNARCPSCGNGLSVKRLDDGATYLRCWGEGHRCTHFDIFAALDGEPTHDLKLEPRRAPIDDAYLKQLWRESSHEDPLLVAYLCSRAITIKPPAVLRVHPGLRHTSGAVAPCLVALVQDVDGRPIAIQRTWLRKPAFGATVGKLDVEPQKMSLGPTAGGTVRLAPVAATLALAEGVETALSFAQATRIPTWAGLGGNLGSVVLPPEVREVLLALDGDAAGDAYAKRLGPRLAREGRKVRVAQAPRGLDFNDLLRGDMDGKGGSYKTARADQGHRKERAGRRA